MLVQMFVAALRDHFNIAPADHGQTATRQENARTNVGPAGANEPNRLIKRQNAIVFDIRAMRP
jgi:hypothetical protein